MPWTVPSNVLLLLVIIIGSVGLEPPTHDRATASNIAVLQNVRAETLPNNSMVVTWTADSGPIKKIYRVIVADSKGTTRYQDIWAASQDKVSVMFDNLRAYENYTVQIRTFHGGRYVKLASIRNQVLLNTPNAPRLNDSTSSSIVLSFDRLKEDKLHDFQYYAEEYRQNQTQDPDARSVLCDSTTATCRIDGLQSNMGYRFKIKACLPRRSQTCSLKSRQSELVHTKPETPTAIAVQMSSADSIAATYVKQPSLANLAVFVKITADRGETVETREAACDNEAATCRISGLEANRAYTVSLRACSANPEPRCSQWSDPTTAYTTPSIPDAPASKISDSDSITVTYSKEPSLVNLTTFVKASPLDDKAVEMREVACDAEETTCRINGLAPNRAYAVSLRTCSANPKPRCSQWSDPTNMYTAPSSPNAPWLNDSTSSSIVLSFDRLKDDELSDFQYYAEEYRQNQTQDPDTQSVLCDNATATCRFDGLHSNTGYRFVLKACATKPSKLCSVNSRESDVVFTKPETPDAPALKAFGASVITVTYANKPGPGNVTMFARAAPADGGALEGREIVCNRERSTCRISGLKADSAYAVSLRACSANPKPRCSKWSDAAAAHTTLSRPRNLLLENVSSDHVDVSWDEPRFSNGAIEKFVVFARDQQNHSAPCVFGTSEFKCSLISLQPTTRYTVSVSACSPTGICGAAARKSIWTRPEKPSNLVISRQEVNSIKCKWQGLSSANKFIHYEVSLHYANNEIRIKTSTVPAHNQATSFSYLHAHTGYSIHLRACANDDSGRPQNCGEAIKTSGYTRPSKPSALTVIQRTSSTLLLHYRKQLKDNEDSHFNYTVTYKSEDNGEDKTGVCNTSTKTCNVTGLAANSKVTASLTACCKHNLCSPPSPEIRVYTKAGACENLHVKSLTTTSIEASWSKPRVNADALTNYEAIATDPQGRQSFCVVPAINQERLVCTFHGLSPCLEYAISVSACARLNDCGLPISMNASTLPAGVEGLSTVRSNFASITFSWMPQSIQTCTLKNTTVVVRRKNSVEQVGSCSVSEPGSERSCTVTGLNSNEDYVASAVACYDGLGRCSEETDSIEVSTLPGVLSQVNSSDLSGHSVVVKWQQASGILTDLSGFVARAYRMYENQSGDFQDEVVNCTASITEGNACMLSDLQPSTNYSIQVAAFKMSKSGIPTYGDESAPIIILTPPIYPSVRSLSADRIAVAIANRCVVFVVVLPEGRESSKGSNIACDWESATCHINDHGSNHANVISLQLCSSDPKSHHTQRTRRSIAYTSPDLSDAGRESHPARWLYVLVLLWTLT